jgi:serine/threonine protein kinase
MKTHPLTVDYTFEKMLGYGAFGEVRLGRHKKLKMERAIKKMILDTKDPEQLALIINEITILVKVVYIRN